MFTSTNPNLDRVPFYALVALGVFPGVTTVPLVVGSGSVLTVDKDISDFGDIVFPTAGETWEVVSDNANDTAAGSGLRSVILIPVDFDSVIEDPKVVNLNGTTPVVLTGTNHRSSRVFAGVTSGTVKSANTGTITLRVSGGGATRAQMLPGSGSSFNSFYHVPAGKTAVILQTAAWVAKGEDATVRSMVINTAVADAAATVGGEVPIYQNSIIFPIESGILPEKFDFWNRGSSSVSANVTTVSQIVEFDMVAFDISSIQLLTL